MFDTASPYKGKVTAYDAPIYIADAALYLKTTKPELGIKDPYSLTQTQFDAAVALLKDQHALIGEYWNDYTKAQPAFDAGHDRARHHVAGHLQPGPGQQRRPEDGAAQGRLHRLERHLDGVVEGDAPELHVPLDGLHHHARTCRRRWPQYFGEAPANPKACDIIASTDATFCDMFKATDDGVRQGDPLLGDAAQEVPRRLGRATACRSPNGSRPGPRSRADLTGAADAARRL